MATYNEQVYNLKNKLSYSKELELLDALDHQLNEAANNLDIDKIQRLLNDFEKNHLNKLRMANQQSFEIIKSHAHQRILEIKKRKELLAQRQREIQNTEDAYKKLQDIKKMVLGAKTKSELEKAKKKYEKWKNEIGRSRNIKFGWKYNKKIDNLKSAIDEGIGPEEAMSELKKIIDHASHSGGFENTHPIKDWMNKYPLNAFHEVYKKEVSDLTDKAFSLVKQPEEETENIKYLSTLVPGFMFMSPTQAYAINDLKKIMDKNSNNFKGLLEWIYIYRNVSFSEPYRQAISVLIPVEYGLNSSKQYSIPAFYDATKLKNKEIKNLVKDTVINYFGILLCGNDLTKSKKQFIVDTYAQSQTRETIAQITENDEAVDTIIKAEENSAVSVTYYEKKNITEITFDDKSNESKSPLQDVSKSSSEHPSTTSNTNLNISQEIPTEIQVEISSILPDIEFIEEQFTSSSIIIDTNADNSKNIPSEFEKDSEEIIIDTSTKKPINRNEKNETFEITASYEEISESAIEIPLAPSETIRKKIKEISDSNLVNKNNVNISSQTTDSIEIESDTSESDFEITYSETSKINSENTDPYQLTDYDVENIENLYYVVNLRTKQKTIKSKPIFEYDEQEEGNDFLIYQQTKD